MATCRYAPDHPFGLLQFQATGGVIVEKKQRLGTENGDSIGTHRNQVNADAIETVEFDRQPELRADTVRARNQQWIPVTIQWQLE